MTDEFTSLNDASAPEVKITFCNRAYADKWFKALRRQSPSHFAILQAIISEIQIKNGGDISKSDLFRRSSNVEQQVAALGFDIIPGRGQMLKHNGNGIRHAKFAPSKSIAVVWENIGGIIFVTFDDHAPIRYHRAIRHLRDIKLGKDAVPKRARISGKFLKKLKRFWKLRYTRELIGFDPRQRYYE